MDSTAESSPDTDPEAAKPAPALALDWCQQLRKLLTAHHRIGAAGYSAQRDAEYRWLRQRFLDLLKATPSLKRLSKYSHYLPPTLSDICSDLDRHFWGFSGKENLVRVEGMILTVLERTSFEVFPSRSADPRTPGPPVATPANVEPPSKRPNRARQRAERRKAQAHGLRAEGRTIKEIARALGCSERTVSTYLQDAPAALAADDRKVAS
jgi:hypothetical protein